MNAQDIIDKLNLEPFETEDSYYKETYRSSDVIPVQVFQQIIITIELLVRPFIFY